MQLLLFQAHRSCSWVSLPGSDFRTWCGERLSWRTHLPRVQISLSCWVSRLSSSFLWVSCCVCALLLRSFVKVLPRERPVSSTSTGFLHRGMCRGVGRNDEGLKLHSGGRFCSIGRRTGNRLRKCRKSSLRSVFMYLLFPQSHETPEGTLFLVCLFFSSNAWLRKAVVRVFWRWWSFFTLPLFWDGCVYRGAEWLLIPWMMMEVLIGENASWVSQSKHPWLKVSVCSCESGLLILYFMGTSYKKKKK